MPSFSNHRRYIKRAPRRGRGGAAALFALCIGWTLALAHAAQVSEGQNEDARERVAAELRVGAPAPAPVADVADARASLRTLHTRVRYAPNQHPFAAKTPHAAARHALTLPQPWAWDWAWAWDRDARETSGEGAESASQTVIARRWPLPRSNCSDSDPDADAARRQVL